MRSWIVREIGIRPTKKGEWYESCEGLWVQTNTDFDDIPNANSYPILSVISLKKEGEDGYQSSI